MELIIEKPGKCYVVTSYRNGEKYIHVFPRFIEAMKFAVKYFGEDFTVIKEYWEADGGG